MQSLISLHNQTFVFLCVSVFLHIFLSLSLYHAHTHTTKKTQKTHTHTNTNTHIGTNTHKKYIFPISLKFSRTALIDISARVYVSFSLPFSFPILFYFSFPLQSSHKLLVLEKVSKRYFNFRWKKLNSEQYEFIYSSFILLFISSQN